MTQIQPLTRDQENAIACLSEGLTQGATAERLGLNRITVNRWCNHSPAFAAELASEIERRQERSRGRYQEAADEVQDKVIAQYKADLLEFQQALRASYKTRINRGIKMFQKAGARFDDLPEESIGMKDIAPLVLAADRLLGQGFEGWALTLGVTELLQRMEDGEI